MTHPLDEGCGFYFGSWLLFCLSRVFIVFLSRAFSRSCLCFFLFFVGGGRVFFFSIFLRGGGGGSLTNPGFPFGPENDFVSRT